MTRDQGMDPAEPGQPHALWCGPLNPDGTRAPVETCSVPWRPAGAAPAAPRQEGAGLVERLEREARYYATHAAHDGACSRTTAETLAALLGEAAAALRQAGAP